MIRTVALWGAEIGWRGQRDFEKELQKLQYQALRKATRVVSRVGAKTVNKIAGVEDV